LIAGLNRDRSRPSERERRLGGLPGFLHRTHFFAPADQFSTTMSGSEDEGTASTRNRFPSAVTSQWKSLSEVSSFKIGV